MPKLLQAVLFLAVVAVALLAASPSAQSVAVEQLPRAAARSPFADLAEDPRVFSVADLRPDATGDHGGAAGGYHAEESETLEQAMARCADLESCEACNQETGCHFCAFDRQCHALMSPWGCLVGMPCAEAEECIRTTPEWHGYAGFTPLQSVLMFALICTMSILAVTVVGVVVFACLRWRRGIHKRRMPPNQHLQEQQPDHLSRDFPISAQSSWEPLMGGGDNEQAQLQFSGYDPDYVALAEEEKGNPADTWGRLHLLPNAGGGGWQPASDVDATEPQPLPQTTDTRVTTKRGCTRGRVTRWVCGFLGFVAAAVLLAAVVMYPNMPRYSMCNVGIEWRSIFEGMLRGETRLDVDVHVAVYNPNRFGITVHRGEAILSYKKIEIGRGRLNQTLDIPAGSVMDEVFLVRFLPGLKIAAELLQKHLTSKLVLDARMDMDTSVSVANHRVYRLNTTYELPDMDVGEPGAREWCLCRSKEDLPAPAPTPKPALLPPPAPAFS